MRAELARVFRPHRLHRHDLKLHFLFCAEVVQDVLAGGMDLAGILDQLLTGWRSRLLGTIVHAIELGVELRFDLSLGWFGWLSRRRGRVGMGLIEVWPLRRVLQGITGFLIQYQGHKSFADF